MTLKTLVLGIGNILWADEGFGVRCIALLNERYAFSPAVTLMDGGTQGLYLLPYVNDADRLIIFDAIDYGLPPGTIHLVEGDDVPRFAGARKMSLHQTGFQDVLAASSLLGKLPNDMLLIGVQPVELMDFGGSLRAPIRACVETAVAIAVDRLAVWGETPTHHETGAPDLLFDPSLDMPVYENGRPSEQDACRTADRRVLARLGQGSVG